jgi:hypothetical protein
MSFSITFYGPKHFFWPHRWDAWFHTPDEESTGGVGFNIPFVHACFMWGKR